MNKKKIKKKKKAFFSSIFFKSKNVKINERTLKLQK